MSPSHFHKVQTVAKKLYNACWWPRSGFLAPSSSLSFFHLHHQQPVCCEIILYPMLYCNHAIILIIPLREIIHVCISFPHLPFLTTPSHLSATEFTDFHNWHIFSISYSAFSWIWDPNIYRHRLGIEITQTDRRWTQRQRENEIIMNKHKENGNIYRAQKNVALPCGKNFSNFGNLTKVEGPFSFPNQIRISHWVKLHIWWWIFLLWYSKDSENKWKYISILTLCLIWSSISIVGSRWSPSEIKVLWWNCHFYRKGTFFQTMSLICMEFFW